MLAERIITAVLSLGMAWALNKARKSSVLLKRLKADYEAKLKGEDKNAATEAGRLYYKELRGIAAEADEETIRNEVGRMHKKN
jgi:hypothetical protein